MPSYEISRKLEVAPVASTSTGRSLLVVADVEAKVADITALLTARGFTVATACVTDCAQAVRRGVFEAVLVYSETVADPAALAVTLGQAGARDVRFLGRIGEALIGDASVSVRQLRALTRILESACSALGGPAVSAELLARTAARVTRALGGAHTAADRSLLGAYAVALCARTQPRPAFPMPTGATLRALLGPEAAELDDLIASCDAPKLSELEDPVVLAVWAAATFVYCLGSDALSPENVSAALTRLREDKQLPARAIEALASVVAETVLATG